MGGMTTLTNQLNPDISTRTLGTSRVLMVKGSTDIQKLSGAILKSAREGKAVLARAVGAGAVNQACKGCAIARDMGLKEGLDIIFAVEFATIMMGDEQRSAISFVLNVSRRDT